MGMRIATGLILAPILVWLLLLGPKTATFVVLIVATGRCVDELLRMSPGIRVRDRLVAALLAMGLATTPLLGAEAMWVMLGLMPVALLALVLVEPGDVAAAAQRAALSMLAIGYVGVLCAMMVGIFHTGGVPDYPGAPIGPYDLGRGALLSCMGIVFLGDTGAYFAGRSFGRHKLYPLISPKKTVEGAIGGLAASVAGGALARWLLLPNLSLPESLLLGGALGAVGQIGDLVESLFKRATDTKDSGQLLPGHGGLLDRLDGVLFAAPLMQAWLLLIARSH